MCDFGIDGLSSGRSPDRLDALVWAATALVTGARSGGPRIAFLDWGPPSPLVPLWRR
jgi:phage terminase large subunit-like protein